MKVYILVLLFSFLLVQTCNGQYSQLTEKERQDVFSVFGKAESLEKAGKISESENELRHLADKYPAQSGVWYVFGLNLFRQKKSDEAISAFKKSLSIESEKNSSNLYLGFTLMNQKNDFEAAIPYLKKATESHLQDFRKRNLPLDAFNQHLAEALYLATKHTTVKRSLLKLSCETTTKTNS
jgi:tetratricopeptide (TPR) repeat protein